MVEFLFTEDNNSVDSEEQSSEYFYDISTSNMLNSIRSRSIRFLPNKEILCFLVASFLGKNFWRRDCATLLKTNFFKIFFKDFD